MEARTYSKGQTVWALWRYFSRFSRAVDDVPPKAFEARVRKVIELGEALESATQTGKGFDMAFSVNNVFEIAIGLRLMDTGLTQSDAAFLIKYEREQIAATYDDIMRNPPAPRQNILHRDRPNSPKKVVIQGADEKGLGDPNRAYSADTSVFMAFRKVELLEAWGPDAPNPFIYQPKFFVGVGAAVELLQYLADFAEDNIRVVIELANMAVIVTDLLEQAPEIKRGRPRKAKD